MPITFDLAIPLLASYLTKVCSIYKDVHYNTFYYSKKTQKCGSSHCGSAVTTSFNEVAGLIPGLAQWVKDPALLWLWCRPAAVAWIQPLAWEPPYATAAALKRQKKQNKTKTSWLGVRSLAPRLSLS